jgi:hypothetical protein
MWLVIMDDFWHSVPCISSPNRRFGESIELWITSGTLYRVALIRTDVSEKVSSPPSVFLRMIWLHSCITVESLWDQPLHRRIQFMAEEHCPLGCFHRRGQCSSAIKLFVINFQVSITLLTYQYSTRSYIKHNIMETFVFQKRPSGLCLDAIFLPSLVLRSGSFHLKYWKNLRVP